MSLDNPVVSVPEGVTMAFARGPCRGPASGYPYWRTEYFSSMYSIS